MEVLLGAANQGELWDVPVGKVQGDGVSSFALGAFIDDAQPESSIHIKVWDLEVSGDEVPLPVVSHDGSRFGGLLTWGS